MGLFIRWKGKNRQAAYLTLQVKGKPRNKPSIKSTLALAERGPQREAYVP